jgi:hypothetical protein
MMPPVNVWATLVTVPEPTDAQVPSPRQNVEAEAEVPELRLVTGRFPVTPVVKGRPVALVKVPLNGVPNAPPFKRKEPAEPVLIANAVATPVPNPEIPVDTGKPVAFVNVPEAGVPNAGVVNDGLFKCVFCWVKFVPSLHTVIILPAGMATLVAPTAEVVLPITVEL